MKNLYFCLLLAMLPVALGAQTTGSGFTIGVSTIDIGANLSEAQALKLESKMLQVIEKSGVATAGYSSGILLKPAISVEDTRIAEGGMQNITVTTCELTLYMVNAGDNMIVYNTMSRKLRGSGSTAEQARNNAINTMDVNDERYKQFMSTSKQKIIAYYNTNCNKIMKQAAEAEKKYDYEAAVSLLSGVPMEVTCYTTANRKALSLYTKYEQQLCNKIVTYARGEMAIGNYEAALDALATVSGRSACNVEANQLIAEADKKVQRHIDRQYNLQAQQARALETIAMGYYMRSAKRKK
ncbi:MAG: hypothetical protein KF744_10760 [Taibaiella sp.]|nr:hypothetical protein [Taibaiella sp.]